MHTRTIWLRGAALIAALCAAACGAAQPVEVTQIVEVTAAPRVLRVAYPSEPDFGDLPSLMALAALAEQGYAVLPTHFAQTAYSIEALAAGDAAVGFGSTNAHWAAVSQGAPLVTVMEQVANIWQIYAARDIQNCSDLHGRRFAISGQSAVNARMAAVYFAEQCPGSEPQIVIIQGSQNRAAALLAGEVDATPIELADAIQLDHDAPGRFHTLTNFGQDLPGLRTTGVHFNRDFAARNPASVRDFIKALLLVHRRIQADHELLAAEAARRLDLEPETLPAIVEAYFAINAWDVNGGLTEANAAYSLRFFQDAGAVDAGLTLEQLVDLRPLDDVLGEIGRLE